MDEARTRHDGAPASAHDHAWGAADEYASAPGDDYTAAATDCDTPGALSERLARSDRYTRGESQRCASEHQALASHLPLLAYMDALSLRACTWTVKLTPVPFEMPGAAGPSN